MPNRGALKSLLTDTKALEGILETQYQEMVQVGGLDQKLLDKVDLLVRGREGLAMDRMFLSEQEAIIQKYGRPALLIQDGMWEPIEAADIRARVAPATDALRAIIPRVGRVEIIDDQADYLGTGWMIAEDIVVTNRHVAVEFGVRRAGAFGFRQHPDGGPMRPRLDFLREHQRDAVHQIQVEEILFIEDDSIVRPDMALLRLSRASAAQLPPPIELDDVTPSFRDNVAVIGYPAEDPRNDAFDMRRIFKDVFRVKRLSPGWISGVRGDAGLIMHDCTTLGGNSGSVVINLATGKACGLHYAGYYLGNNYAVTSVALKQRLAEITPALVAVPARAGAGIRAPETPAPPEILAADLAGRRGYDPDFLGAGELSVPLPVVPDSELSKLAVVRGESDGELRYTHFSIKMRADRRLAFFTAVNIDGGLAYNIRRTRDRWFTEPRLENRAAQVEGELYVNNELDRGHLVRRLDPAWGATREEAIQAVEDTFFFTNCSPQHQQLNQEDWLSLEDYVLDNAATHGLKVSVFSGPVLGAGDREYRGVRIPEEYWKVVVIVNEFTGKLSATGYLLSQADYITDLEFKYGAFRTYQVPIRELATKTGLDFGDLVNVDPLGMVEGTLSGRVIRGRDDLVL